MSRAGRKLKSGYREPNGKPQRPTAAKLDEITARQRRREQQTVLDQPHRRDLPDPSSTWASSALGRLCILHKLKAQLYSAGEQYASIVACWRAAKGAPSGLMNREGGSGGGPDDEAVRRWQARMVEIEKAVMREGMEELLALRTIAIDEADVGLADEHHAINGLMAAAVELGLCRQNDRPY